MLQLLFNAIINNSGIKISFMIKEIKITKTTIPEKVRLHNLQVYLRSH